MVSTHKLYKLMWLAVSVVLLSVLMPRPAAAAGTAISLTTSPVSMSLTIQPGTSVTKKLQLMNNSVQPVKINMELDTFGPSGTSGQAIIKPPSPADPSVDWVTFSPSTFIAQPSVWTAVSMTISLPKTAALGYYYAVVFKPDVRVAEQKHANIIKASNGVFVLVDTGSGNENRQVSISGFSADRHVYEYLPATFTVSVRNGGNIYMAPFGNIYISRSSDMTHTIAAMTVNGAGGNVLPHSDRNFQMSWSDSFPVYGNKTLDGQAITDKQGKPVKQLSWDFSKANKFRFGKYYAKLTLVYNNGKQVIPVTSEISFWVIPWKLILGAVAVVALLLVGMWSIGRTTVWGVRRIRIRRR
jgi:hypothetical protein